MTDANSIEPPRLGSLETQVMDVLWDNGTVAVRGVIDRLASDHAYTTIATVLSNLSKKGLVTAARSKRSTEYSACCSREEYVAAVMNHALDSAPDRSASMLHFIQTIPANELALLREYLNGTDALDAGGER